MRVVIKGDGSGIVLINYADKNYEKARSLQTKSALKVGFNKIIEYGPGDVEPDFLQAHIDIFQV